MLLHENHRRKLEIGVQCEGELTQKRENTGNRLEEISPSESKSECVCVCVFHPLCSLSKHHLQVVEFNLGVQVRAGLLIAASHHTTAEEGDGRPALPDWRKGNPT